MTTLEGQGLTRLSLLHWSLGSGENVGLVHASVTARWSHGKARAQSQPHHTWEVPVHLSWQNRTGAQGQPPAPLLTLAHDMPGEGWYVPNFSVSKSLSAGAKVPNFGPSKLDLHACTQNVRQVATHRWRRLSLHVPLCTLQAWSGHSLSFVWQDWWKDPCRNWPGKDRKGTDTK